MTGERTRIGTVSRVVQLDQMFRLDGRSALVIGAGSGIGRAVAAALGAFGATVVCADRDGALAEAAAAEIGGTALTLDLTDAAGMEAALASIPTPHVAVSTPSVNVRKRIVDYTDDDLDRVVDLNLKGTFRFARTMGRRMAEAGRGSLIGFSSVRSLTTEPGQGAYAATKAATVMLFRTLAAELGPAGVRANVVAPGVVETPLTAPIKAEPAWYQAYADKPILRRWAQPEELAGAVVYLASDASTYVTGTVLFVDGGWTAADGRYDPPN
jgi:NAD(P)-dependent dehydrogenase (short-subunit alcohol dehydrogenase family)